MTDGVGDLAERVRLADDRRHLVGLEERDLWQERRLLMRFPALVPYQSRDSIWEQA